MEYDKFYKAIVVKTSSVDKYSSEPLISLKIAGVNDELQLDTGDRNVRGLYDYGDFYLGSQFNIMKTLHVKSLDLNGDHPFDKFTLNSIDKEFQELQGKVKEQQSNLKIIVVIAIVIIILYSMSR